MIHRERQKLAWCGEKDVQIHTCFSCLLKANTGFLLVDKFKLNQMLIMGLFRSVFVHSRRRPANTWTCLDFRKIVVNTSK